MASSGETQQDTQDAGSVTGGQDPPTLQPAMSTRERTLLASGWTRSEELQQLVERVSEAEKKTGELRVILAAREQALTDAQAELKDLRARVGRMAEVVPLPRRDDLPVDELINSLSRAAQSAAAPAVAALPPMSDRARELEHDLRAAEDQINGLEAQLRQARGQPPLQVVVPGDAPPTEFDPAATDNLTVDEFMAEGPARFLALIDGDTEILHRLRRRTTIGRAADNDIQIDARFVSRYHATVLAGPTQTIIEDLGSTNGIVINSRRATRQVLRDGDVVRIGKSRFRFLTRPR